MGSECLDKYLMPITVADIPLDNDVHAYKMDGTEEHSDMRKDVGLGTCNCCDYFQIQKKNVLLIEETKLFDFVDHLKLQGLRKTEIIKRVRNENRLKVYGSMLILCRLVNKFNSICSLLKDKPFIFVILVSSDTKNVDDSRFYDALSTTFREDLKSVLSKKVVRDVEIGNPDWFREKYFNNGSLVDS